MAGAPNAGAADGLANENPLLGADVAEADPNNDPPAGAAAPFVPAPNPPPPKSDPPEAVLLGDPKILVVGAAAAAAGAPNGDAVAVCEAPPNTEVPV